MKPNYQEAKATMVRILASRTAFVIFSERPSHARHNSSSLIPETLHHWTKKVLLWP